MNRWTDGLASRGASSEGLITKLNDNVSVSKQDMPHFSNICRLGPLSGPSLGLLEAEMARVFGLGFSWPDAYTQCVFQTLIYKIQHR